MLKGSVARRRLVASLLLLVLAATTASGWGGAAGLDGEILRALHGGGPAWLRPAAANLTALGSGLVLALVVAAASIGMVLARAWRHAALLVGAAAGGGLLVDLAKRMVARPRPAIVDHLVDVTSLSWPSAHAANSAIVYLTLGALAGRLAPTLVLRRYIGLTALLLTLLIGTSRIYLGVHWPSDVAGGWLFGGGCALFAATLGTALARREEPLG